jgi:peptide-methionine (S)-S-oxide reductase
MRYSRPIVLALGLALALVWRAAPAQIEAPPVLVPPPVLDEAKGKSGSETAVLAGGCFWGVQAVFQHVKGVTRVVSGYSGGDKVDPTYQEVSSGRTGHAESVEIRFDPAVVSYGEILRIYFSVAHNPTEIDRQGPDAGTQYRSHIFAADAEQARIAGAYVAQLDAAKIFPAKIATRIDPLQRFYPAEDYHQDFLTRHPDVPYIVFFDMPKLASLKRLFPDEWREQPVLVSQAHG